MVLDQLGALQDVDPGIAQFMRFYVRVAQLQRLLDMHLSAEKIPAQQRLGIKAGGSELDLFIFEQAAHQFGARVLGLDTLGALLRRQQHARLDLDQHRCHQQIFAGELEVVAPDLFDIAEVLARHIGQRYVEDIEVLAPDQVEQQIERPLERLEKNLQRIRRDVQIERHLEQRLAIQPCNCDRVDRFGQARHSARSRMQSRQGSHAGSPCVHPGGFTWSRSGRRKPAVSPWRP